MIEIAVLTTTRAEYGILSTLIKKLNEETQIKVSVLVTGAHLLKEQGYTIKEIEKDGIEIAEKIDIYGSDYGQICQTKDVNLHEQTCRETTAMGNAVTKFGNLFAKKRYNGLIVLGDRYETLGVCSAAMLNQIPIIHLHGGEITEGAVDEAIRHSITKMSYLHLTSTESYRKRVIQLGEHPENVYNVGALGVENALRVPLLARQEILGELCIAETQKPYFLFTYHPVTLETFHEEQLDVFEHVFDQLSHYNIIITKSNMDKNGDIINAFFERYASKHEHVTVFASLGLKRYLSAVRYSAFIMGNSSSGIIEVPSFHVPTINIGNRQKGRIQADSVINVYLDEKEILNAVKQVENKEFLSKIKNIKNPYEGEHTSEQIVEIIKKHFVEKKVDLKKKFYDIEMENRGGLL